MTTSSEDVLLQVPQVKYKKGDGTLFLMDSRLAWMVENRDTVAVSHLYADIKTQKISQEGKSKVQLQVVLHNGLSSTFHFTNKNGPQAQAADRDRVKELLQSLLPQFKRKVDRELEEKNKLLSSNPALLQLYKDLVISEVVSSEEFWAQHAASFTQKKNAQIQEIGVSGAFLADIKPQTDGCNGLKYNITPDIIDCIFKTYPAVKKKYHEHVPAKMTESQFWTKFFQSHYFHRDRKYAESKDVFTECGKIDDQELKKDIQKGVDDPLVNLSEMDDYTVSEGYGAALEKSSAGSGTVSQAMIKRFNQHSRMVLKASKKPPESSNTANGSNGIVADPKQNGNGDISDNTEYQHKSKKQKIIEKITYDDLDNSTDNDSNTAQLNLSKIERYLHGPMPDTPCEQLSPNEITTVSVRMQQELGKWRSRLPTSSLVSPTAAAGALGELSPGGALMVGFQQHSLAQLVPPDREKEIHNLYLGLCELLSHFWKCLPATTPASEQKFVKMHEALHRYHAAKLKPFEDKLIREMSPLSHQLTKHLNQLLNIAYQKFNAWQKIKMNHR